MYGFHTRHWLICLAKVPDDLYQYPLALVERFLLASSPASAFSSLAGSYTMSEKCKQE
jgi:hypothetical protein